MGSATGAMERRKLEIPDAPPATGQVVPKMVLSAKTVVNPPTESLLEYSVSNAAPIAGLLCEFVLELHAKKRFEDALIVAKLYRKLQPAEPTGFYNEALMLFHLGRHDEASNVLMWAPAAVWELPQYHHNMACIQVAKGNVTEGLKHATAAARQNKNALRAMLKDPDLRPIWAALKRDTRGIH